MVTSPRHLGLILIVEQAAQEKSTLAAWYFRETKRPSLWINRGVKHRPFSSAWLST